MPEYRVRVHIASPMEGLVQKCFRCGEMLTDMRRASFVDGDGPIGWRPGAFIGITEHADGRRTKGSTFSMMMDRDAQESDEIACTPQEAPHA